MDGLKQIMYGVTDFARMRRENVYFVDRTGLVRELEKTSYAMFLRPRRFGKSLWCAILQAYYRANAGFAFDEEAVYETMHRWYDNYRFSSDTGADGAEPPLRRRQRPRATVEPARGRRHRRPASDCRGLSRRRRGALRRSVNRSANLN